MTLKKLKLAKLGKKMSPEFKEKQRKIHLGKKMSETSKSKLSKSLRNSNKIRKSCFSVIQYDINTKQKINEYYSMKEAERQTGIAHSTISKCCKDVYKQAGGYIWKYGKK